MVLLGIVGCKSATSVPKGIIPLNDMKVLMWDVAQADAYCSIYIPKDSTHNVKEESLVVYQKVFSLHKITKDAFLESMHYYENHPEKHKILIDSLAQYAARMKETNRQKLPVRPLPK